MRINTGSVLNEAEITSPSNVTYKQRVRGRKAPYIAALIAGTVLLGAYETGRRRPYNDATLNQAQKISLSEYLYTTERKIEHEFKQKDIEGIDEILTELNAIKCDDKKLLERIEKVRDYGEFLKKFMVKMPLIEQLKEAESEQLTLE